MVINMDITTFTSFVSSEYSGNQRSARQPPGECSSSYCDSQDLGYTEIQPGKLSIKGHTWKSCFSDPKFRYSHLVLKY